MSIQELREKIQYHAQELDKLRRELNKKVSKDDKNT